MIAGPGAINPPANLQKELDKAIRKPPEPVVAPHPAGVKAEQDRIRRIRAELDRIRAEMIRLINEERAKPSPAPGGNVQAPASAGWALDNPRRKALAPPLVEDAKLSNEAQGYAERWANKVLPLERLAGLTLTYRPDQKEAANAAKVIQNWMSDPSDRRAILFALYTRIGVGVTYSSTGVPHYTLTLGLGTLPSGVRVR